MTISKTNRALITKELDYVARRLKGPGTDIEKIFYYSAAYGVVHRVLNIEYDPTLVFIYHVLESTCRTLNFTVANILRGEERVITIPADFFEKLSDAVSELSAQLKKGNSVHDALERIINIAYIATGNGYYLYLKKTLKL